MQMDVRRRFYCKHKGYFMLILENGHIVTEHKYIYQLYNGDVPEGYTIHHANGNKKDNRIENLVLMTPQEHAKLHREWDADSLSKICKSCKRRLNYNMFYKVNGTRAALCKECYGKRQKQYQRSRKRQNRPNSKYAKEATK